MFRDAEKKVTIQNGILKLTEYFHTHFHKKNEQLLSTLRNEMHAALVCEGDNASLI